jgi:hypothetical protein
MTEEEALLVEAARRGLLPSTPAAEPDTSFGARAKRFGLGVVRGMRDPVDAGAQLLSRGLEAAGLPNERENVERINREAEAEYQKSWRDGVQGFDAGRLAGNIALTAPALRFLPSTVTGAAATGALSGAMTPVDTVEGQDPSFWAEKLKQTGIGAAAGGAGGALLKGASKVIQPTVSPEVQTLIDAGVRPTPGQILGGGAQRLEEGLTSLPFVGDVVKRGQLKAVESFDRAAIDRVLKPIGERLDFKTKMGREAIDEMVTKTSAAYDDLLPKLTVQADQQFAGDMTKLFQNAQSMPRFDQFQKIVTDKVFAKFNPQTGMMTGETMKEAESELGRLARDYARSADPDQRLLGDALKQTQAHLREMVERSNPQQADRLAAINKAYAMQLRVENAAGRLGSKEGVFSPAALQGAVKQVGRNNRQFARGDALMQDLSEAGVKVLGQKVPDSGTPFRLAVGAGAPAAAYLGSPALAAGLGLGMLPYTGLGQRVAQAALTARPQFAGPLSQSVGNLAPVAAAAGPPLMYGLLDQRQRY